MGELVRARRYEEALAELYGHAEQSPGDRAITTAIERVREAMAEAALAQLGPEDAAPRKTGAHVQRGDELGADDRYLLGLVDGTRTLGQLIRASSLGRHRTSRTLVWLARSGFLELSRSASTPSPAAATRALEGVLVADGSPTQAALVRTMLRVSLGRGLAYHTATSAGEAIDLATRTRPGLAVLDFRLPGQGDGIQTLRAIRELPGLTTIPAALVVQRIEVEYARSRLPARAALLVRPIERSSLEGTLATLVGTS